MQLSLKPDFDKSWERYKAFWERELVDRPPVCLPLPSENPRKVPKKRYDSLRDRWLDVDFRAEVMDIELSNTVFYADAMPMAWPNLGPEIYSAWCGCGYEFGETTAWSEPCINDWSADADKAVFSEEHPLFKLMVKFTKRLQELGRGKFIVGLTDFHPGGDHLAALRDPQRLATDMYDNPEQVKAKLESSQKEYFRMYDIFYDMLKGSEEIISTWTPLVHDGRYYVPSNDFSCMVSKEMFDEFFLPGIIKECQFYERSIYHLDGPGALRHLDSLLEIKELDAIQWVPGAGRDGYARWIEVYRKIQAAGKAIELGYIGLEELPLVFETLRPEGVWFNVICGVHDRSTADEVLKRISAWK